MGIFISGLTFWGALEHRAEAEVTSKALVLMETVNAVRNYTQDRVNPLLKERIETKTEFTPEAIPTFAAREVFDYFRKNPDYAQYLYKDAAPNPTNPRDLANEFETELVNKFKEQSSFQQTSGWSNEFYEGEVFYIARPFTLTKQSCLECHSTPSKAPQSLLTSYGSEGGFGWELNHVVAAQIVYVPAEEIFASVRRSFVSTLVILAATFMMIILALNFLLKRFVIRRIQKISRTAQAVSRGDLKANFEENSQDEIGLLVMAFDRMRDSVVIAVKRLNQKR
jgi:HAMP domain-containing protein